MSRLRFSIGRDPQRSTRFEFCMFDGDRIVAREGSFRTWRAAFKAADAWGQSNTTN